MSDTGIPELLKELRDRLAFLELRVNSHSDPAIQKLIADTQALISKREASVHKQRLINLGQAADPGSWRRARAANLLAGPKQTRQAD